MKVESLSIPDVKLITGRVFSDERGQFAETWRHSSYASLGIGPFVQDNVSVSRRGVVRGLHLQHPRGQGKLVSAMRGTLLDVAVDVRVGSPTFGRWVAEELSASNAKQLYIPAGFAHGFMALTDDSVLSYKCTDYYSSADELTVRWNDPQLGIAWPDLDPILARKDAEAPLLAEIPQGVLPTYSPAIDAG
jgi:dTDP-4-dehydrorhamnose 3,5-epimerase